ncbi:hypothetical protein ABMY35_04195 [Pseudoalteromonas sp. BZB3]|uniref:hypothetical protein n=1 Tax=Pseudoalteromonas sp. BZB3 TaxID=3136670 RepID=UPI0032C47D2E
MKTVLALVISILLMLSGCQSPAGTQFEESNTLKAYVADLSCDASFQCKVIGVGERAACGGPSNYVVFSTKNVDENEVERLADAETTQERILNERQPPDETCKQVLPIQSLCIKSKCESFTISN